MNGSRAERAVVTDWWLSIDRTLLALILLLALFGVAASIVATPPAAMHLKHEPFYFATRHAFGMALGLAAGFAVSLFSPAQIRRLALVLFLGGIVFMALALLQGVERNGATRWLYLGGMVFQPSEFVKPGFAILMAWLFSESVERPDMPALEIAVGGLILFLALLILEPDMGQAILVTAVWIALFFLSGYSLRLLPIFGGAACLALFAAYKAVPHFASRIDRFFGAAGDTRQATIASNAFRDAGWLGKGIGEGFAKGRLPDAHNDYVFAAIAAELGIAACLFLILIYALIVWRVLRRAFREEDRFARLAVSGLIMIFGLQALVNMAVNLNLVPAKGMTLPLVSYGRSSLIASTVTLGMVLALTRRSASFDLLRPAGGRTASEGGTATPHFDRNRGARFEARPRERV